MFVGKHLPLGFFYGLRMNLFFVHKQHQNDENFFFERSRHPADANQWTFFVRYYFEALALIRVHETRRFVRDE